MDNNPNKIKFASGMQEITQASLEDKVMFAFHENGDAVVGKLAIIRDLIVNNSLSLTPDGEIVTNNTQTGRYTLSREMKTKLEDMYGKEATDTMINSINQQIANLNIKVANNQSELDTIKSKIEDVQTSISLAPVLPPKLGLGESTFIRIPATTNNNTWKDDGYELSTIPTHDTIPLRKGDGNMTGVDAVIDSDLANLSTVKKQISDTVAFMTTPNSKGGVGYRVKGEWLNYSGEIGTGAFDVLMRDPEIDAIIAQYPELSPIPMGQIGATGDNSVILGGTINGAFDEKSVILGGFGNVVKKRTLDPSEEGLPRFDSSTIIGSRNSTIDGKNNLALKGTDILLTGEENVTINGTGGKIEGSYNTLISPNSTSHIKGKNNISIGGGNTEENAINNIVIGDSETLANGVNNILITGSVGSINNNSNVVIGGNITGMGNNYNKVIGGNIYGNTQYSYAIQGSVSNGGGCIALGGSVQGRLNVTVGGGSTIIQNEGKLTENCIVVSSAQNNNIIYDSRQCSIFGGSQNLIKNESIDSQIDGGFKNTIDGANRCMIISGNENTIDPNAHESLILSSNLSKVTQVQGAIINSTSSSNGGHFSGIYSSFSSTISNPMKWSAIMASSMCTIKPPQGTLGAQTQAIIASTESTINAGVSTTALKWNNCIIAGVYAEIKRDLSYNLTTGRGSIGTQSAQFTCGLYNEDDIHVSVNNPTKKTLVVGGGGHITNDPNNWENERRTVFYVQHNGLTVTLKDFEVKEKTGGLILKDDDGVKWRLRPSTSGEPIFTKVV